MREVIIWKGFTKTTYLVNQMTGERTEVSTGIGAGLTTPGGSASRSTLGGDSPSRGRRRTPPKHRRHQQRGAGRQQQKAPKPGGGGGRSSGRGGGGGPSKQQVGELTERCVAETESMKEALASVQTAIDAMMATAQAEGLELELGLLQGEKASIVSLTQAAAPQQDQDGDAEPPEEASVAAEEAAADAADAEEARTILVTCPEGVESGDNILIDTPDGDELEIVVPDGVSAGDDFEVNLG